LHHIPFDCSQQIGKPIGKKARGKLMILDYNVQATEVCEKTVRLLSREYIQKLLILGRGESAHSLRPNHSDCLVSTFRDTDPTAKLSKLIKK